MDEIDNTIRYSLRYVGKRFHGAHMPVDALPDLVAFRDLILSFAKDIWRRENADRQRLPKGFDRLIDFELLEILPGSSRPQLAYRPQIESPQPHLPGFESSQADLVAEAYAALTTFIQTANEDGPIQHVSSETIRGFNRFGSGLREGEVVEFEDAYDSAGNVVSLDLERRRRMLTRLTDKYEMERDGFGVLRIADLEGSITVVPADESLSRFEVPVDPEEAKSLYGPNLGSLLHFDIVGEFDHDNKLKRIVRVNEIDLVDDSYGDTMDACTKRLIELDALAAGWLNGEGEEIGDEAIAMTSRLVVRRLALAEHFRLYPTVSGGISIEFEAGGYDLTVRIERDGAVTLDGLFIETDEDLDEEHFPGVTREFLDRLDQIVRSEERSKA